MDFYTEVMLRASSDECINEVKQWFDRNHNFTELYDWVHMNLEFVKEGSLERHTYPSAILQSGKGKCQEFSILYVAACLAHGYESRLVVAVEPLLLWFGHHAWAEVKQESWIHVDPSDRVWNQTSKYQTWSWGNRIGCGVVIYAFGDIIEDVTATYMQKTLTS